MLKKSTYTVLPSTLQCCCLTSTSPAYLPPPRARPRRQTHRLYADIRSQSTVHSWPESKEHSHDPTPYDILHLGRKEEYSKRKFYELVKIYHPDRSEHDESACQGISAAEKLERYRLIIRAHEILSDPVKRREYDNTGAGWRTFQQKSDRRSRGYYGATCDKPFGTGAEHDSSPFQNATWEDWEKWYRRDEAKPNTAQNIMSPNSFASLVLLLAVISGVAQATRAGQYSSSLEDRIQKVHHETNSFLVSRADEYTDKAVEGQDRVKWFLEKRDPEKSGLKLGEEEAYIRNFAPINAESGSDTRR
ncbi:MAG: hypothetical protein Q9227_005126 [Pyrenula ochraceoflavens]